MDRLAEIAEYNSAFRNALTDEDFLAAGYTPEEISAYRGQITTPSLTQQDITEMQSLYGTLEAPEYSMRENATQRVQDALIRKVGMDPYQAGVYARRVMGDPNAQGVLDSLGLADLTPMGAAFAIEEGSQTAVQGYERGDPLQMGLGVLEAGLGVAEAFPLTKTIARGISETAAKMDPNTLYSVFGPPIPAGGRSNAASITAYHGSPHDFDRFSMSKIGTGEGAQAYGHGLYFAEAEPVARMYRDQLSQGNTAAARRTLESVGGDVDKAITETEAKLRRLDERAAAGDFGGDERRFAAQRQIQQDKISQLRGFKETGEFNAGRMYEVNIAANPEDFLDWDKPLSEQPKKVQDFANARWQQIYGRNPDPSIEGEYIAKMASPQHGIDDLKWLDTSPAADQAARLREAGIPGIKYLDQGSRAAGEGSRNYVVFDENLIEIVKKYGIAGAATLLGVSAIDVEQALADNLPQSEWDQLVIGP
jgi:hypothetical protein